MLKRNGAIQFRSNAGNTAFSQPSAAARGTFIRGLKYTAGQWAMIAVVATASTTVIAPQKAKAHGAWLGICRVDYSSATVTEIQTRVNAGDDGIGNDDFIEYTASCPVLRAGTESGPGGYITFYKPSGTEIAGAWIIDAAGTPINARPATSATTGEGISRGWGPINQRTFVTTAGIGWNPSSTAVCATAGFTAANCNSGLAYVYGDTGIFYSTRSDTAMFANGAASIGLLNGYRTNPTNAAPWRSVLGTGDERVHNKWDAVQTNAFGSTGVIANGFTIAEETVLSNGRGTTPFNAGSPVAGPDSGAQWDRYGTTGPWNRISYPGSCFANDPTIAGTEGPANGQGSVVPQAAGAAVNSVNVCTTTTAGVSVSDTTLLSGATNALRFALGGIHIRETHRVRVRLKVTNAANLGLANFEGHGGDSTQGAAAGNDNPWRYWIGAPGVAAEGTARLYINKAIVAVNGAAYNGTSIAPGATIRYRVSYTNAFTAPQTNVVVSDILPAQATGTANFTVISGPNIVPAALPTSGTFNFLTIASLAPGSGAVEFDVTTNAADGQTVTNVARINSTQVATLQTDNVTTIVVTPTPPVVTNDSVLGINGANGAANVLNAFTGDTVGGAAATSSNATLTVAAGSAVPAGLTFDPATGNVGVVPGTPAGTYSFVYTLCAAAEPLNCADAAIMVTVNPSLDLMISKSNGVSAVGPGSMTTYTVVITNNGPDTVSGAVASDVPGTGINCPATNPVTITGSGVPSGSFTIAGLTGPGITLGTLLNGESTTLSYSCQII